jgi:hypothetical protein
MRRRSDAEAQMAGGLAVYETRPQPVIGDTAFRYGFILLVLLATGFAFLHRDIPGDDGYIAWRVARNIVDGNGWVYNLGEHSNPATSPLQVMLLALLGGILNDVPLAGWILASVGLAAAGLVTALWLRDNGYPFAGLTAGFLIISDHFLISISELETPVVLFLLSAVLWSYGRAHLHLMAVALALLVLARHDAILLAPILLVFNAMRERDQRGIRIPWSPIAVFGLITVPWFAFALYEFGSPFPNTLAGKIAQGRSMYWNLTLMSGSWHTVQRLGMGDYVLVGVPLASLGLLALKASRQVFVLPLLIYAGLHFLAYTLLGVPTYEWYYYLAFYAFIILTSLGAEVLLRELAKRISSEMRSGMRDSIARSVLTALAVVCIIGFSVLSWRSPGEIWKGYTVKQADARELAYLAAGRYIREMTPSDARVAITEIGAFGWASERTIVDYMGLLSTDAAERLEENDVSWWVDELKPEYVVFHQPHWPIEQPAANLPEFMANYELVRIVTTAGYEDLEIWHRLAS